MCDAAFCIVSGSLLGRPCNAAGAAEAFRAVQARAVHVVLDGEGRTDARPARRIDLLDEDISDDELLRRLEPLAAEWALYIRRGRSGSIASWR